MEWKTSYFILYHASKALIFGSRVETEWNKRDDFAFIKHLEG